MITRGNELEITQNQTNLREKYGNACGNACGMLCVQVMVTRYFKAYPCLQNLIMCGNTLNMTETDVTNECGNFSNCISMDWP